MRTAVYLVGVMIAAGVPFLPVTHRVASPAIAEWPEAFEGRPLIQQPLTDLELRFANDFPGAIARFSDGTRTFIFRRMLQPTRKLHPSIDCFRGAGYSVTPAEILKHKDGRWSVFHANRNEQHVRVEERIIDQKGKVWTDVSAWYWNAMLDEEGTPWTAITIVESVV